MADEKTSVASSVPSAMPYEQPEKPEDSPLGVLAPFDWSSEPFVELSDEAKGALDKFFGEEAQEPQHAHGEEENEEGPVMGGM